MKTEVFKPILSQCWILVNAHVPSKYRIVPFFFCVNEQNGFKNSTCKRLFLETEKRIQKCRHQKSLILYQTNQSSKLKNNFTVTVFCSIDFSEKLPRKHNIMNTYLKQIPDISAKISAKFSTRLDFRRKVRSTYSANFLENISWKLFIFMTSKIKLFHILDE